MKVLILCTGNSCRSQMAHGFLQSFDKNITVCSAGTEASGKLNQKAVQVMKEIGIDIGGGCPKSVDQFTSESFDYVITVCDHAKETCPIFTGKVVHRLHIGFDDPAGATGTKEEILSVFRRVRDDIKEQFYELYTSKLIDHQG